MEEKIIEKEKNLVHSFEELDIWKRTCRLSVDLYRILNDLKDWGFRDQVCRAAVSIPSNIAERFERGSTKEFIHSLYIAKGSAGELRTQLYLAIELSYIQKDAAQKLIERCRHISAMIQSLITSLKRKSNNVKR
jgi:four helix bundle protein